MEKYVRMAFEEAEKSNAEKRKVGAILVLEDGEIAAKGRNYNSIGKCCENKDGETLSTVFHAEESAIMQALNDGYSLEDATLVCTYSPCINCCRMIVYAGIKKLLYVNQHKKNFTEAPQHGDISPKDFLKLHEVRINRYDLEKNPL